MDEKGQIEWATAEAFLDIYNENHGNDYKVIEHSDSPDFCCENISKDRLNLEITLIEDQDGAIQALLGRSNNFSLDELKRHIASVKAGKEEPLFTSSQEAATRLKNRICEKLKKDYGPSVALVVRDTSRLDLEWDSQIGDISEWIRMKIEKRKSPFDKGVWIFNKDKDIRKIWRLDV